MNKFYTNKVSTGFELLSDEDEALLRSYSLYMPGCWPQYAYMAARHCFTKNHIIKERLHGNSWGYSVDEWTVNTAYKEVFKTLMMILPSREAHWQLCVVEPRLMLVCYDELEQISKLNGKRKYQYGLAPVAYSRWLKIERFVNDIRIVVNDLLD